MNRIARLAVMPLALITVVSLLFVSGCGGGNQTEFTQAELEDIFTQAVTNTGEADSFNMAMDFYANIEMIGGPDAGTGIIDANVDGAIDAVNEEGHINMDLSMDAPGTESDFDYAMETYVVDSTVYLKMDVPDFEFGDQWLKTAMDSEMMGDPGMDLEMDDYTQKMMDEAMQTLEQAVGLEFQRYENFDGGECYVLSFVLDWPAIMDLILQLEPAGATFAPDTDEMMQNVDALQEIFDELSFNVWIDKDTNLMKKLEGKLKADVSAEDLGETSGESVKIDMTFSMECTDYNQPVDINLPSEAENAIDLSDFMGMGGIPGL